MINRLYIQEKDCMVKDSSNYGFLDLENGE